MNTDNLIITFMAFTSTKDAGVEWLQMSLYVIKRSLHF